MLTHRLVRRCASPATLVALLTVQASGQDWKQVRSPDIGPVLGLHVPSEAVQGERAPIVASIETPSLYAIPQGGSAFSMDGGLTWRRRFDASTPELSDMHSPAGEPNVLLGARYAGWRSVDFGKTWEQTYYPSNYMQRIAVDPQAPERVYGSGSLIVPSGAFHRSVDGGQSWESYDPIFLVSFDDLVVVESSGGLMGTLITAAFDGIRRSRDGGDHFEMALAGVPAQRLSAGGSTVWSMGQATLEDPFVVWRSTDSGAGWEQAQAPPGDLNVILAHPNDSNRAWIGANSGVFFTQDGGAIWTQSRGMPNGAAPTSLHIDPTRPGVLLAGCEGAHGGVWRSDDEGLSWTHSSTGMHTPIPDIHFDQHDRVWGIGLGTPVRSLLSGPLDWETLAYSKGATSTADALAIHPTDPNTIVWLGKTPQWHTYDRLLRSTDGGQSWNNITPNAAKNSSDEIREIAFDDNGTLFAGAQYGAMYLSNNLGEGWTSRPAPWSVLTALIPSKAAPGRLHACDTGGRYFLSDDQGVSWSQQDITPVSTQALDLHISPSNPDVLFVVASNNVGLKALHRSVDGGQSWSMIKEGLPSVGLQRLAVDPNDGSRLLVGTEFDGVFLSLDGGASFTSWNGRTGDTPVVGIEVDGAGNAWLSRADGRLFVRPLP